MTNTRDDLLTKISEIDTNHTEIEKLPKKVQDSFGNLVAAVRVAGHTASGASPFGHLGVEEVVDHIWQNRDKYHRAVEDILAKLGELVSGLAVPVTFVDYANEWRNIGGEIIHAGNKVNQTSLRGEWDGIAATRYWDARILQEKAVQSMPKLCEQVALSLESVAVATLDLYISIAKSTADLVSSTLSSISTIASKGPLGVTETDELVKIALAAQTFIINTISSVATTAQKNMIEGNRIAQATSVQDGIPNNKWPQAVTGEARYDDGTVTDGTNKWSVRSDRTGS
ncbi:hypothetical protein IU440_10230 [Nocardia cyriacigeorgica]|uniref:hypothetical protein n=1 Tax=Nocardia cyriacigeorgica TaxID=135487 RepID=UPI001892F4C2|nr:hypothetical protein [Nocardia cyriacigeorgica]MBF6425058.1 hypothetical protein [Nocardia cyriacigeorgica]